MSVLSFSELPLELLQQEIAKRLDLPTLWSLSQVSPLFRSRLWHHYTNTEESIFRFNSWEFLGECARLGYWSLIEEAVVKLGAKVDVSVLEASIKSDQFEAARYILPLVEVDEIKFSCEDLVYIGKIGGRSKPKGLSLALLAARRGEIDFALQLGDLSGVPKNVYMLNIARAAAFGGFMNEARKLEALVSVQAVSPKVDNDEVERRTSSQDLVYFAAEGGFLEIPEGIHLPDQNRCFWDMLYRVFRCGRYEVIKKIMDLGQSPLFDAAKGEALSEVLSDCHVDFLTDVRNLLLIHSEVPFPQEVQERTRNTSCVMPTVGVMEFFWNLTEWFEAQNRSVLFCAYFRMGNRNDMERIQRHADARFESLLYLYGVGVRWSGSNLEYAPLWATLPQLKWLVDHTEGDIFLGSMLKNYLSSHMKADTDYIDFILERGGRFTESCVKESVFLDNGFDILSRYVFSENNGQFLAFNTAVARRKTLTAIIEEICAIICFFRSHVDYLNRSQLPNEKQRQRLRYWSWVIRTFRSHSYDLSETTISRLSGLQIDHLSNIISTDY